MREIIYDTLTRLQLCKAIKLRFQGDIVLLFKDWHREIRPLEVRATDAIAIFFIDSHTSSSSDRSLLLATKY